MKKIFQVRTRLLLRPKVKTVTSYHRKNIMGIRWKVAHTLELHMHISRCVSTRQALLAPVYISIHDSIYS